MHGEADVLGELLGRRANPAAPAMPVAAAPIASRLGAARPWLALVVVALAAAAVLFGAGPLYVWLSGGSVGASAGGAALAELSEYVPLLTFAWIGAWLLR